jgi:hypothetical protein
VHFGERIVAAPKIGSRIQMDDLTKRACRAYFRRLGAAAPQPTADLSAVEHSGISDPGDVIVLRNVNGEIARFDVRTDGTIRFVASAIDGTATGRPLKIAGASS